MELLKEATNDRIRNHKTKLEKQNNPHGCMFQGVASLKQETDQEDEYLIYDINGDCNNRPAYVFKTSKFLINLTCRLHRHAWDYLSTERVFFDGSHKRCKGFKTITVAFYHPLVRKMVKILTIDVKSETSESFVVMWELLNECLQKLTKNKNYKFNPTGWMADENGANWNGIEKVFGKDSLYRVVSCKFHF